MVRVIGSPISTSTGIAETCRSKSPIAPVKISGWLSDGRGMTLKTNLRADRNNRLALMTAEEAVEGAAEKRVVKKTVAQR